MKPLRFLFHPTDSLFSGEVSFLFIKSLYFKKTPTLGFVFLAEQNRFFFYIFWGGGIYIVLVCSTRLFLYFVLVFLFSGSISWDVSLSSSWTLRCTLLR